MFQLLRLGYAIVSSSLLAVYCNSTRCKDVPEFIERVASAELNWFVDATVRSECYLSLLRTNKIQSANLLCRKIPGLFSFGTFTYALSHNYIEECKQMMDMGLSLDYDDLKLPALQRFYKSRECARKAAVAVLGVPRRSRGTRVGITKDVAQIIARVIWSNRNF